jgi:hypothetical protein
VFVIYWRVGLKRLLFVPVPNWFKILFIFNFIWAVLTEETDVSNAQVTLLG